MVPEDESDSPRLLPSEFLVKFSHYLTCNAVLEKKYDYVCMINFVGEPRVVPERLIILHSFFNNKTPLCWPVCTWHQHASQVI